MRLTDLHRRLLADVLALGAPYALVLTGGHAVQAHGLGEWADDIARRLAAERGYEDE